MKEVKTIAHTLIGLPSTESFDEEVNEAIRNGWTLVSRQAIAGFSRSEHSYYDAKLIAFLEREVKTEEYL